MGCNQDQSKKEKQEIKEHILNYIKEQEQIAKYEIEQIYETRKTLPQTIFEYLKEKGTISCEEVLYFPEKFSFTREEYFRFFDKVLSYLKTKQDGLKDNKTRFDNRSYYFIYQETILEFTRIYGQGTASILSLAEESDIEGIDVGTYEEWLTYIEEKYKGVSGGSNKNEGEQLK